MRWGFYYYVIGEDGSVYNLARCTTGLRRYVGHEVELTGKPTLITLNTTVVHAASTVKELPALEVESVKELQYRNPAKLAKSMAEANKKRKLVRFLPSEKLVTRWVEHAQKLPQKITYR